MRISNGILIAIVMMSSACGSTPYREEFACSLKDDYGKCIDVQGAYREAVNGVDSGAPRLSQKGKPVEPPQKAASTARAPVSGAAASDANWTSNISADLDHYGAYRSALYQQLRSMLRAPATPMVRAPQTVRTLILSYEKRDDSSRLYMPRYVFSIHQGPSFVLGQYLDRSADLLPSSVVNVSQDDLTKDRH